MADEEIKFSEEKWKEFYENFGSKYFQLESATLKAHGDDQKKLLYEIFGSTKTLVQTIGVVAGFGFTAISYVENLSLFILGEFFLFVAIFYGLFWTQKSYRSNLRGSIAETDKVKKLFAERYSVFKKIYDKALSDISNTNEISIPKSDILDLQKKGNELMEKFTLQTESKNWSDPFNWLMFFFAIGGTVILLSFFHLCFFN
jgi:hypothetical protein